MKLSNKDLEQRIYIKLDKSIKDDVTSGFMRFGENNDYPQIIEKLIYGSQTAKSCSKIFSKFIVGEGFNNPEIGQVVIGQDNKGKKVTLNKMLRNIAESISLYSGFYIHANINLGGMVEDTRMIPFKNCRFSTEDDRGFCSKIAVSKNWTDKKTKKNSISWYNTFNTQKEILHSQIKKSGSVDNFKGQIYFSFIDDSFLYPLSPFDCVYLDMDTEQQIQLYKNREIRNGFSDKVVFNVDMTEDELDEGALYQEIENWMSPNGAKALVFQSEFDDETGQIINKNFKFEKLENNINDKLFKDWEVSLANNIRKAVNALPSVLIDYEQNGLSQASGEMVIQATNFYNNMTKDVRNQVAESIKELYSNFNNHILSNNTDWNIKPISTDADSNTNV